MKGMISVISIGPGSNDWIPPAVLHSLEQADILVGYRTYLDLIKDFRPDIPREYSGMRQETERVEQAIRLALSGRHVAVISGGDAGIYGMAGLVIEKVSRSGHDAEIEVTVLPGISALNAAASLLGAPLMNDFAVISLSDYLTPLDTILDRVSAAAQAGFVLCLYNPRSSVRSVPYERTLEILNQFLPPDTPVGIVKDAFRPAQAVSCVRLAELPDQEIRMNCILIVGNAETRILNGRMVTPRGYTEEKAGS